MKKSISLYRLTLVVEIFREGEGQLPPLFLLVTPLMKSNFITTLFYRSKDVMTKPMKGRTEKQVVAKKLSKPNKSRFIKRGPTPEGDDDR